MGQDTVKIGEKVRSIWHDGFDTHFYHATPRCARATSASPLCTSSRASSARWSDQLAEKIAPHAKDMQPPEVKRVNEMMWELKDLIKNKKVTMDALKELITENGVYVSEKATPPAMLHGIADGLINGKLAPCPWCDSNSLEQEGTLIRCYGYSQGSTHCTFKANAGPDLFGGPAATTQAEDKVKTRVGTWTLNPTFQRALKDWKPPPDAPVHKLTGGGGGGGGGAAAAANGGGKAAASGKGKAKAAVVEETPSEDEDDVAPGTEMAGMSFACVGSLKNPNAAELQELIEAHSGKFVSVRRARRPQALLTWSRRRRR